MKNITRSLLLVVFLFAFTCVISITNAQTISTIAGTGVGSYSGDGALATIAMVNRPLEIHVDAIGNKFIVDSDNHRIRKIHATSGIISTVVGTGSLGFSGDGGQATAANINSPTAVCTDPSGNIYIADKGNQRIRKVDISTGIISTLAGNGTASFTGDGGPSTAATLSQPHGMQTDNAGNLYFCDRTNHRVRKIDAASGIINTVAGTGTSGYSGDGGAATSANLNFPIGLSVDNFGIVYVADQINHRIRSIDTAGIINTVAGIGTPGFSGDGSAAVSAQLNQPYDVSIDANGDLYISDTNNQRIRKVVSATGIISTHGGNGTGGYSGDGGPATSAQMNFPSGIAADAAGTVYIGDKLNHRVREINSCNTTVIIDTTNCLSYTTPSGNNTYSISGTYIDIIQNGVGCDSVITINLTIPQIDTSVTSSGIMLTSNTLSASYQWLDCDNGFAVLTGDTAQVFTASSNGNFAVEITLNGCTDTSTCNMVTFTSFDLNNNQYEINVFPNPASDQLHISFNKKSRKDYAVKIYDSYGRMVGSFMNQHTIAVTHLKAGVYLIRVEQAGLSGIKRFVKL